MGIVLEYTYIARYKIEKWVFTKKNKELVMEQILFKQFDPLIYMYMTQPARTRLI